MASYSHQLHSCAGTYHYPTSSQWSEWTDSLTHSFVVYFDLVLMLHHLCHSQVPSSIQSVSQWLQFQFHDLFPDILFPISDVDLSSGRCTWFGLLRLSHRHPSIRWFICGRFVRSIGNSCCHIIRCLCRCQFLSTHSGTIANPPSPILSWNNRNEMRR